MGIKEVPTDYHPELFDRIVGTDLGVFAREGLKVVVGGLPTERFVRRWEQIRGGKNDIFCSDEKASSFSPGSVDVICLGFNLDFLDDSSLKAFFRQADSALVQDGLIICLINAPLFPLLANGVSRFLRRPSFKRSFEGYAERAGGLFDVVYEAENFPEGITDSFAGLIVFAKKGAYGEAFKGLPYSVAA